VKKARLWGLLAALAAFGLAAQAWAFELSSPDIQPNGTIANKFVFKGFGCKGDNISPALMWKDPPAGTKSFAVNVYDPDAPTGSGWWHWVIFNIPATATGLVEGAGRPHSKAAPRGAIQSRTDFGKPGYGGPCPPQGDPPHHYIFTVYALKLAKLPADLANSQSSAALIGFLLHFNTIDKASFTGLYGR
jgi:Raf kinase inhibitor-like YbhB/YbcL family protein